MLLRAKSRLLEGWTGEATVSTRHPAASYRSPMLLINGEPVGPIKADWAAFEILDATSTELEALRRGNYHFAGRGKSQ